MAVSGRAFYSDGYFALNLYPDDDRERIEAAPPVPGWHPTCPVWFYWDGEKHARGEYDFLGVTVIDLDALSEEHLAELARLPLPRVDCPDAGFADVEVVDVLRWAKRTYPGRNPAIAARDLAG